MCKNRSFKCLVYCVIICMFLIMAFIITSVALIYQTPNKLGFGNKEIFDSKSLSDIGLADLKIVDLFKGIIDLRNFKEEYIMNNPYDTNVEAQTAKEHVKNSNLYNNAVDFSSVLIEKVTYDNIYLQTYNDTTLAFILNAALNSVAQNKSNEISPYGIQIKEISITKNQNPHAKILLSFPRYNAGVDFSETLLKNLANSPIIALEFDFSVSSDGNIVNVAQNGEKSPISCVINNGDKMITTFTNHLFEGQIAGGIDSVSKKVADCFINMLNNLGRVGNASVLEGNLVQGTPLFGQEGVSDGQIKLITYKN